MKSLLCDIKLYAGFPSKRLYDLLEAEFSICARTVSWLNSHSTLGSFFVPTLDIVECEACPLYFTIWPNNAESVWRMDIVFVSLAHWCLSACTCRQENLQQKSAFTNTFWGTTLRHLSHHPRHISSLRASCARFLCWCAMATEPQNTTSLPLKATILGQEGLDNSPLGDFSRYAAGLYDSLSREFLISRLWLIHDSDSYQVQRANIFPWLCLCCFGVILAFFDKLDLFVNL